MTRRRRWAWGAVVVAVGVVLAGAVVYATRPDNPPERAVRIRLPSSTTAPSTSTTATTTTLAPPPETAAPEPPPMAVAAGPSAELGTEVPAVAEPRGHRVYTYSVIVDGAVNGRVGELAAVAAQVWNDDRSWHGVGIDFVEVESGGSFTLVLVEPSHVPSYAPGTCDTEYSCTNGGFVAINDDRWVHGSPNWPGPLDQYRTMVLNHEVGHFLGLGHQFCGGGMAPIMQQQSISLQGCAPNAWPLPWELDQLR